MFYNVHIIGKKLFQEICYKNIRLMALLNFGICILFVLISLNRQKRATHHPLTILCTSWIIKKKETKAVIWPQFPRRKLLMISRFTATIMIIIAKQPPYFLTEQEQSPLQCSIYKIGIMRTVVAWLCLSTLDNNCLLHRLFIHKPSKYL